MKCLGRSLTKYVRDLFAVSSKMQLEGIKELSPWRDASRSGTGSSGHQGISLRVSRSPLERHKVFCRHKIDKIILKST